MLCLQQTLYYVTILEKWNKLKKKLITKTRLYLYDNTLRKVRMEKITNMKTGMKTFSLVYIKDN